MSNQERHPARVGFANRIRQLRERANQSSLRSAREQTVFLYFLIVFILVSIHLDRNSAAPIGRQRPARPWTCRICRRATST